jgi:hypothetical protein
MEGIKLDERNYRVHDEKNKSLINKSLQNLERDVRYCSTIQGK